MNIQIKVINKNNITSEQDIQINFLCQCFPKDLDVFPLTRYCHNVTPRMSILFYEFTKIVAHLARIDRVIHINGKQYRVAGIDNVCVHQITGKSYRIKDGVNQNGIKKQQMRRTK